MRTLAFLDYAIIVVYIAVTLIVGMMFTKKASQSTNHFFLSNRSLPWWLIGLSMAATNFSIDTPIAITKYVAQHGISGVWFFWSSGISFALVAFFLAKFWRRARVVTDVELIEHRYSGRPAKFLRLFKGFYFGVLINCFVMGWVFTALIKIIGQVTSWDPILILVIFTGIVFVYTVMSGFYGVVLTDFVQYFIALFGSILLAYCSVQSVGGIDAMVDKISLDFGNEAGVLRFFPRFDDANQWMPVSVFMVYLTLQWWSHKYSDGGGKHIQRMSAAKNEHHAMAGTFLFGFLNYAVQVWPWILTALCALATFGKLADPEVGYPMMMLKVLPTGLLGLVIVSMLGAFMSTIDTHLNLGASYLINDMYRRFMVKEADEKHYLRMSRIAMLLVLAIGAGIGLSIKSVGSAWKFILAFTSGAGVVWILRWFWWRINAWAELSAMVASGVVATGLKLWNPDILYSWHLLTTVGLTACVWVPIAYLTKPTDEKVLVSFVKRVRPGSSGWNKVYKKHGIQPDRFILPALVNGAAGVFFLFCLNFGIGSLCLGRLFNGIGLLTLAILSFAFIFYRMRGEKLKESASEPLTDNLSLIEEPA